MYTLLTQHLEILCSPPVSFSLPNQLGHEMDILCCVKSNPYLFFSVTRCLEYLSSGENRAGCADLVTSPETTFFRV